MQWDFLSFTFNSLFYRQINQYFFTSLIKKFITYDTNIASTNNTPFNSKITYLIWLLISF